MTEVSKDLEKFLNYLRQAENDYKHYQKEETDCNNIIQDILHNLELQENSYHEMARLAKEIRRVRLIRREAKDFVLVSAPLMAWVEKNRPLIKEMERLLGDIRNAENSLKNRIYFPKNVSEEDGFNYFTFDKVLTENVFSKTS